MPDQAYPSAILNFNFLKQYFSQSKSGFIIGQTWCFRDLVRLSPSDCLEILIVSNSTLPSLMCLESIRAWAETITSVSLINVSHVCRTFCSFCVVIVLIEGHCCLSILIPAESSTKSLSPWTYLFLQLSVTLHFVMRGHQCLGIVLIMEGLRRQFFENEPTWKFEFHSMHASNGIASWAAWMMCWVQVDSSIQ